MQITKRIFLLVFLVLIGAGIIGFIPVQSGFLFTDDENRTLLFIPNDTKEIVVGWRHSVELTPWEETYYVLKNGDLTLESTIFKSYGAGTPDTEGEVELLSNGYISVTGVERTSPYYSLFYIPMSNYYIRLNGKKYPLSEFVPDYHNVLIHYKTIRAYEWIREKI